MVAGLRIGSRPYREYVILDKGVDSVPDFADSVPDFAELQLCAPSITGRALEARRQL